MSAASDTRRPNERLSGGEPEEFPVIARSEATKQSPARESRRTCRAGDCFVASLLAMTRGRYPLAYVNLFGAWYKFFDHAGFRNFGIGIEPSLEFINLFFSIRKVEGCL
jgi:hypothetical protein